MPRVKSTGDRGPLYKALPKVMSERRVWLRMPMMAETNGLAIAFHQTL
jgi:hypothetical protein